MIVYDTVFAEQTPGLSQRISAMAPTLSRYGFGAVLFPPTDNTKNPYSLGFDPRTHLDWGQWKPLHITGSASDLYKAVQTTRIYGLRAMKNFVRRQMGAAPCYERNANGVLDKTLFPKPLRCFVPAAKRDQTFDPNNGADDGRILSYLDTLEYVLTGVIQSSQLADKVFGWDDLRLDEGKGFALSVLKEFSKHLNTEYSVSEVYSADQGECAYYIAQTGFNIYDFLLHYIYRNISNGAPLSQLTQSTLATTHPDKTFAYVESHDTDGSNGIVNNKLWFYLHCITSPCKARVVFAKDYEIYGLGPHINNMVWFADAFCYGPRKYQYADNTLVAWSQNGDGGNIAQSLGAFCGFSSEPIVTRKQWIATPFKPYTRIHDYSGHGPDLTTNADGWCEFVFGPNVYGSAQNYVMYAEANHTHIPKRIALQRKGTGNFFDFSSVNVKLPKGWTA